jgi:hypothetical protein
MSQFAALRRQSDGYNLKTISKILRNIRAAMRSRR